MVLKKESVYNLGIPFFKFYYCKSASSGVYYYYWAGENITNIFITFVGHNRKICLHSCSFVRICLYLVSFCWRCRMPGLYLVTKTRGIFPFLVSFIIFQWSLQVHIVYLFWFSFHCSHFLKDAFQIHVEYFVEYFHCLYFLSGVSFRLW